MALTQGQKIGLVAAVGVGAFLLAGGSSAKAAAPAPATDPCTDPKDCAALTLCANKAMVGATKADIPKLQGMMATAKKLGCSDLATLLGTVITALGTTLPTPPPPTGSGGTTIFNASKIKNRQQLINKAWTLSRLGPNPAVPVEHPELYPVDSNGSFHSVPTALSYPGPVVDVQTGLPVASAATILVNLQDAAGLTVDGKWGAQSQAAFSWGLHNGSPTSIGGEGELDHVCVGSECSACDRKKSKPSGPIENPESLGGANTLPSYEPGYVKFDRTFGSQFGAGPSSGPLSKYRAFGSNSRF